MAHYDFKIQAAEIRKPQDGSQFFLAFFFLFPKSVVDQTRFKE